MNAIQVMYLHHYTGYPVTENSHHWTPIITVERSSIFEEHILGNIVHGSINKRLYPI